MDEHIHPNESVYEEQLRESGRPALHPPVMEELKERARERGPVEPVPAPRRTRRAGARAVSNLDYAPLAEIMGRSHIASEATNCAAPDTGNMEVLTLFGSPEQKERWLRAAARGRDPVGVHA